MWDALLDCVAKAYKVGAVIALELSSYCEYWKLRWIIEFLEALDMRVVRIPGCAVGLVSIELKYIGQKLYPPWDVATTSWLLARKIERNCSCNRKHPPCEGRDTPNARG